MVDVETPVAGSAEAAPGVQRAAVDAVNAKEARSIYEKRPRIHPRRVRGTFRRLKWGLMIVTLGIYYLTPWIRWDRGPDVPDQAVLIDLPGQRLYFFFIEIWPQEVYYLTGLLILAAIGLFLVTSVWGRAWCGYACPQTVWTDLFIVVERWIEGDRNARIRLDRARWGVAKLAKRAVKHTIWIIIGILTGGAWVFYFVDAPTLVGQLAAFDAPTYAYIFIGLLTSTTYLLGGLAREQVCIYMCPWPRIQAAMVDEHTLTVSYRGYRGEPRGPHKKGHSWEGRGDCVDCKQCVVVCPMGIDISDGEQLECITCGLCLDACNNVMEKVGRPGGLIGYDTMANMATRAAPFDSLQIADICGRAPLSTSRSWPWSPPSCWLHCCPVPRSTSRRLPTATRFSSCCPTAASATAMRSRSRTRRARCGISCSAPTASRPPPSILLAAGPGRP